MLLERLATRTTIDLVKVFDAILPGWDLDGI